MNGGWNFTSAWVRQPTANGTNFNCPRRPFAIWLPPNNQKAALSVQPLHVVAHAVFERELRLVFESLARAGEVGLREVLIVRVRIIEVFGLKLCAQTVI